MDNDQLDGKAVGPRWPKAVRPGHWPRQWPSNWRLAAGFAAAGLGLIQPSPIPGVALNPAMAADCSSSTFLACCSGQTWPDSSSTPSPRLTQTLCELLIFPTASRAETESFLRQITPGSLANNDAASPETMTLPSLWWNRDSLPRRLGSNRLVESWVFYEIQDSATSVVDVTISAQIWRQLTYPERYAVLNQFGIAAQGFGYHLRFFEGNAYAARIIGLYACDLAPAEHRGRAITEAAAETCMANLDAAQISELRQVIFAETEAGSAAADTPEMGPQGNAPASRPLN
ncbi:MAG: hypothetical protein ACFCVD_00935 [Nodosilinea sp.]